jgi:hypothetical protein
VVRLWVLLCVLCRFRERRGKDRVEVFDCRISKSVGDELGAWALEQASCVEST